jgi:MFS family permease
MSWMLILISSILIRQSSNLNKEGLMKLKPNNPIDPSSFKIYYGWILVPIAVIGVLMSMPGQTAGFSAFTEAILEFTGFTRTRLSFFYMIGTISSGFLIPVMGSVLDRWGSRKMMIFASVMLGISLLWLSFLDKLVKFIPAVPPQVIYSVLMLFGIFCLRFFGQGLLPMASNTMIAKWFDKKRGRAIAFMGVINTVALSAAPAVLAAVVFKLSWNGAWRFFALIIGVGMSLIAWVFYRDTPEDCGLFVDGNESAHKVGDSVSVDMVTGATRGRALRSRSFWAIALVTSSASLVLTGLTFHIQAIGVQTGLTVARAVAIFIPVSFIAVPISFASALLTEKIHVCILVTLMAASQLVSYCAIYFLNTEAGYIITIISLGFANGLFGTVYTAVVPKIFGRRHLGSINGIISSAMIIASALGPIFLSAVNDIIGSLRLGVTIMSILPLITIFISIRMPEKCH